VQSRFGKTKTKNRVLLLPAARWPALLSASLLRFYLLLVWL
jgi:hypothetical protein